MLAALVTVTVNDTSVEVRVNKRQLRVVLLSEKGHAPMPGHTNGRSQHDDGNFFSLTVDTRLRRCGREMRLILPGAPEPGAPARFDAALIKALARGYAWYERLTSGNAVSVEALAAELGLTKRYVNRVIRCALLAPDIVELILAGRQPPELTLNRLFREIPVDWAEQRRVFGVTTR